MNTPFFDIPNHYSYFLIRPESDLRILGIGYNDFHFVAPDYHSRTQKYYTFHFVISGKGTLDFEGKTYRIGAGDIFALPPDKLIRYFPDANEPWEYIFAQFDGALAPEYLASVGFSNAQAVQACPRPEKLLSAFKDCFEKAKNGESLSHFEATAALLQFFTPLAGQAVAPLQTEEDAVRRVKEFINTHFSNPELTIEQIANALHFSHSRLCHLFRERTGQTMIAYLNERRMSRAEELLLSTNLSANKIAYASGFSEYTYFLLLFKRKHGVTTSQFRAKSRN